MSASAPMATHHRSRSPAVACSVALLLLLLLLAAAVPFTTATKKPRAHVEPADEAGYRTYIIQLAGPPPSWVAGDADALRAWHGSYLPSVKTALGGPRLRRSYKTVFTGFSARLTEGELKELSRKPGFVGAFPNTIAYPQTTRTPAFLGLPNTMGESPDSWPGAGGRGVIIGVIDAGIDDGHPSLADTGFDDLVPPGWTGSCHPDVRCNRKLIGAKNLFDVGYPPIDVDSGHGTHVTAIAAGNFVADVSVNGLASGNASGVAPYAYVAVYKACGGEQAKCPAEAVLQAFQEAVEDGVHVISASIGYSERPTFNKDAIAIGAYNARRRGVHVVAAAGNDGPGASSVMNGAPWMLTVAAGTVDRYFEATVNLEGPADNAHGSAVGESLADPRSGSSPDDQPWKHLLYSTDDQAHRWCVFDSVEEMRSVVPDKIVICDRSPSTKITVNAVVSLLLSNASAILFIEREEVGYTMIVDDFGQNPVIQMPYEEGKILKSFASGGPVRYASRGNAGTQFLSPAPSVAFFSGRGPNQLSPGILKPDVMAPGLNILSAVPMKEGKNNFALKSGTSMATPHVSGLVALLKKTHPTWSTAIMRSALMTTADFRDNTGRLILDEHRNPDQPAGFYATGAGHVNISRAMDPGLAYDIAETEYAGYLCSSLGEAAMRKVTDNDTARCDDHVPLTQENLNYPSIVVNVFPEPKYVTPVSRLLTNLAADGLPEVYEVEFFMPGLVLLDVQPKVLNFTSPGEKLGFVVTATPRPKLTLLKGATFEGSLTWSSSRGHRVRSPVVAVVGLGAPPQPSD